MTAEGSKIVCSRRGCGEVIHVLASKGGENAEDTGLENTLPGAGVFRHLFAGN